MSQTFSAIILGIIQGVSEFWPVSSSGHLILARDFLGLDAGVRGMELDFDVALHLGTLLAVLFYFKKEIAYGLNSLLPPRVAKGKGQYKKDKDLARHVLVLMIVATIPGALAGYFLEDAIELMFRGPLVVALMLFFYSILLMAADRHFSLKQKPKGAAAGGSASKKDGFKNLSPLKALAIGCCQALAIIPGTSRSGATITAGLFLGLDRRGAARFSFMLSIPIIAGAALVKVPELLFSKVDPVVMLGGLSASFLAGFFAIKYMLKYLTLKSYSLFVIYRIFIALIIFLVFVC